ncbi:MAG: Gfo/Idh/MocA family oxidoreductase [Pirellulales bacterium]
MSATLAVPEVLTPPPAAERRGVPIPEYGPAFPAPELPYLPRDPRSYNPPIGLIGCGGITSHHLTAYRAAGYRVVALCDANLERARQRQAEFYPEAEVIEDYRVLLKRDDIEVLDIATHPALRALMIEHGLNARKHILSQKPFVLDLDFGERMVELAARQGVRLAVNQNGRWAPHFSYIREAVRAGLTGELSGVHTRVHWDHNWVAGTEFDRVKHLILYDFAVHWFDFLTTLMGPRKPTRVFSSIARAAGQRATPALLGQAVVEYEGAQASLVFDGNTHFGALDSVYVNGTRGTLTASGPDSKLQQVTLYNAQGHASPELQGCWFPDGFHGTMGELLLAIEENREPTHSAANNLESLALVFAAVASAETGQAVVPGSVRQMSG